MTSVGDSKILGAIAALSTAILLMPVATSLARDTQHHAPHRSEAATLPANPWYDLQQRNPFPFTVPLPPPTRTILDGTYAKSESKVSPPVHCRRCPDYAPEGGVWNLRLDQGVFRIFHRVTGWRSLGSFFVSRDEGWSLNSGQLLLANDPFCQEVLGLYRWRLEEGRLVLNVIEDPCAIRLRATNLTNLPWLSCQPPSMEAAITDRWPKPPGCD